MQKTKTLTKALITCAVLTLALATWTQARPGQQGKRGEGGPRGAMGEQMGQHMGMGQAGPAHGILMEADTNEDGVVSREEYTEASAKVFDTLDANDDGVLDETERRGMRRSRQPGGEQRVAGIIKEKDTNGDGLLSIEEFAISEKRFERADANDDGLLDKEELTKGLMRAQRESQARDGQDRQGPGQQGPPRDPEKVIAHLDKDDDGKVSAEEFGRNPEAFKRLDGNSDGYLTAEEFKTASARGQRGDRTRRGPMDFDKADANGDGKVAPDEFKGPEKAFQRCDENADGFIDKQEADAWQEKMEKWMRNREGAGRPGNAGI